MTELEERISKIYDELVSEREILQEIDKSKVLREISEILKKIPVQQIEVSESELLRRIRKVLAIGVAFGILRDWSPQELEDFDRIVRRK